MTSDHDSDKSSRELQTELDRLRRVESLGYLTASVIHDFNNLLTPMVCLSAMLARELEKGTRAGDMAAEIRETAERAAGLVRQMLSFVRRAPEPPRRVNVGAVVSELRSLLGRVAGDRVEIALAIDEDASDVMTSREQLEQVLLNLAANARDAMPSGGRLFVSVTPVTLAGEDGPGCHRAGAYVAIRVSDTGVGMSPEVRERVFERFFTTKGQSDGNGLGLAAAHRFAKASGGCISVRSVEGAGTTITLCLPRARADAEAMTSPPRSDEALPRGTETILIVEDDASVRGCIHALLEAQGYRVLVASSGAEAVELAAGQDAPLDLLLTDVVMPGMSGRVLADVLESLGLASRVLFMSGHTDVTIRERDVEPSSHAFLRKAFSPAELLYKVREVLAADAPSAATGSA
jgi:nitrogen-specific signal transduction histidine kinase/ActR/RegA family two-component response regulator